MPLSRSGLPITKKDVARVYNCAISRRLYEAKNSISDCVFPVDVRAFVWAEQPALHTIRAVYRERRPLQAGFRAGATRGDPGNSPDRELHVPSCDDRTLEERISRSGDESTFGKQ